MRVQSFQLLLQGWGGGITLELVMMMGTTELSLNVQNVLSKLRENTESGTCLGL